MRQKGYIKPTKPGLIIGIITTIGFLIFGIFFYSLLNGEPDSEIGHGFLIFWMLIVSLLCGYFIYSLINYDKNDALSAAEEIVIPESYKISESENSFDDKLRKIEKLKKEGLISEEEFIEKRKEIMQEKW